MRGVLYSVEAEQRRPVFARNFVVALNRSRVSTLRKGNAGTERSGCDEKATSRPLRHLIRDGVRTTGFDLAKGA